ncbi:glycosyltransferase [Mangrovibacterium diazotrophicum]|uniref:Glycosyltransferase involved in cell wall biosynthesis n=1 Tax=Mangrovibacterium diazotrophicum TaxID=1261403 RepID=A0A419VXA8_9BACT|nr:glycosyltransferase [Mangrovibacterium diazotrophicum]RKD87804.1 glycosyltransferase involved in cell wall biosynthesis [Mangrovibacterium diazotrophicum]
MTSSKTIKIIGPAYPYRGGLASYNERLAKEFLTQGHQVDIETFTIQYPNLLFPGKTQYVDGPAPDNLKIKRTVNSVNPLNWVTVGKRIKKEKPDILMIRYWLPFMAPALGTICRIVRSNKHTKVICLADNIIPHEKRPGDQQLTSYFMNSIDGMVAMSQSVLDDIDQFRTSLPRALCPHPLYDNYGQKTDIHEAKSLLGLERSTNYLLFFGFIRDYKGLDLLLEAFADDRLKDFTVKLIVAGEFYTKPEPYLELINKLQLNDRVVLKTEFIPEKHVTRYFGACDMVVQPYKSATQSGVTQIGYHFEKPMLVTNVGGLAEIIPDKVIGYVTEPNKESIADALVDFYANNRKSTFEKNILEEKKKFSWEKMVEAFMQIESEIKT